MLSSFMWDSFADIVPAIVLSRNQNFEGCVHPITRDNYLTSPPLVVAYALVGTVCADLCPALFPPDLGF